MYMYKLCIYSDRAHRLRRKCKINLSNNTSENECIALGFCILRYFLCVGAYAIAGKRVFPSMDSSVKVRYFFLILSVKLFIYL